MNTNKKPINPNAFPLGIQRREVYSDTFDTGMTLRDYFAAKAMQALLSNTRPQGTDLHIVKASYEIADAMLKERES